MNEPLPSLFELQLTDPYAERAGEVERSARFGETFRRIEDGDTMSYAALAPVALEANEQLSLDLPGYSQRAAIRKSLAKKIESEVLPRATEPWLQKYPQRLRLARQHGHCGIRMRDGKLVVMWDNKAGLSRLCPDDAREEAMRLRRRVLPRVKELREAHHRMLYLVLTKPSSAPGKLRQGMSSMFEDFREKVLRAKNADGDLVFPQIKGALCVLEAPLGESRDWNVHLNVVMPVKGFLDFAELRQRWGWNVHMRWIGDKPGQFEAAFSELIKYAVAATASKSAEHAAHERSRAPPMLEWTPTELVEWLRAMRDFRRTRAYGAMYKLDQPEAEEQGQIVWIGSVRMERGGYVHRLSLLDSIPEDNFPGRSAIERWVALKQALAPRGLAGAATLGESDAVRSSTKRISIL